jgi:hypothetical protein
MRKIYYKDQQMHFGFKKGLLLLTDHQHVAAAHVVVRAKIQMYL